MEYKQDICPRCGGTETVSGRQTTDGGVIRFRLQARRLTPCP